MFGRNAGEIQSSITKFERMLKTNLIYYFDPQEFEDIVVHYLGFEENQTAKKALKLLNKQVANEQMKVGLVKQTTVDISETNYGDSGGYWNSTPEEMKTYIRRYSRNWALVSIIPTFLFASVLSLSLNMKEGGMKQYTFMSVSALIGAVCVYKAVKYDYIKTLERLQIKTLERLQ